MPHQNVSSSKATEQNSVTGQSQGNDRAAEQNRAAHPEPRSYVGPNVADSTLASPAAGEIADFMDEGDPLGADDLNEGVQQGGNHANRPIRTEADRGQGPKTRAANQRIVKSGEA